VKRDGGNTALLTEIEGMRALAVASVLLYHAGFGFHGGYVGVDVFFVVSGFLITGLLQREFETTGRISLSGFYARRARRLLPAATLVLVATVVLARQLLNPVRAHQTAVDAMWAGGFVANFHFAEVGADYLQSTLPPSLLQHWWSLAVEEQFYIVWPGMLAATWALVRRVRTAGLALCLLLAAASFAIGWQLTRTNAAWGYFASWSRAWELALGGVCAFVWAQRHRLPWRGAVGWGGLAMIGYSAWWFGAGTAFPGTAALMPVVGTMLVIMSIGADNGPGLLLSLAPLQWIGGRSYGIYLWHWPLLMILEERVENPSVAWRVGMLAVSVALAALSHVLLENPIRHLPALARSASLSLAGGALLVSWTVLAGAIVANDTADIEFTTGFIAPAVVTSPSITTTSTSPGTTPDAATDSTLAATISTVPAWADQLAAKVTAELQPLLAASATQDLLPENITPRVSKQADDRVKVWADGCMLANRRVELLPCIYGDPTSSTHILIFGDSHADQWFPGLEAAAIANHWKLEVISKKACPSAQISVMYDGPQTYPECDEWQPLALDYVAKSTAQLVIITNWRHRYDQNVDGRTNTVSLDEWRDATRAAAEPLVQAGKKVLLLSDTPYPHRQVDQCLASSPRNVTRCHLDRAKALDTDDNTMLRELAPQIGATFVETTDWFCTPTTCPAVVGNMAVYQDTNHINNTYGLFLAPYLELVVKEQLQLLA